MDYDISILEECGVNTATGIGFTGNRDKYIQALKRYYNSYESNRMRVTNALKAMDIEDYTIIVHSLKSNSRMIGAVELSLGFEALEMAAKAGNNSILMSDTPTVLNSYDILIKQLAPIGKAGDSASSESLNADEARKAANELLDALDEYDDELSAKLASKLSGYPFDETHSDMLKKASGFIGDFLYDEAADIIRQIIPAIV